MLLIRLQQDRVETAVLQEKLKRPKGYCFYRLQPEYSFFPIIYKIGIYPDFDYPWVHGNYRSNAPRSMPLPWGRVTPRASVALSRVTVPVGVNGDPNKL